MRTSMCLLATVLVVFASSLAVACRSSEDDMANTAMTPSAATETPAAASAAAPAAAPVEVETEAAKETPARARFIPIVRGTAKVGYRPPLTKVEDGMVVTRFTVKNLSSQAIAGLKVEEFWRDKAGNLSGGSADQLREPLPPGATATLTLRTPRGPGMFRNQYRFLHAYGEVKVEQLAKIE